VFWALAQKENVLQLAMVEEEIRRLWGELGMSQPKFSNDVDDQRLTDEARARIYATLRVNPSKTEETVLKATANLGATCRQYIQVLSVSSISSTELHRPCGIRFCFYSHLNAFPPGSRTRQAESTVSH
jgi:hypothetical protein